MANGAAAFSVPLSCHFVERHALHTTKAFLRRYKYVEEFTSMCIRRVHDVSLVDLNALFFVSADAIAKYRIFRAKEGDIGPFRARIGAKMSATQSRISTLARSSISSDGAASQSSRMPPMPSRPLCIAI